MKAKINKIKENCKEMKNSIIELKSVFNMREHIFI